MKTTTTEERWSGTIPLSDDILETLLGVPGMIDWKPGDYITVKIDQNQAGLTDAWFGRLDLNGYRMEWNGHVPVVTVTLVRQTTVEEGR